MSAHVPQEGATELSARGLTILRLMADGLSNQEIADRLFLALTTVKWYIRQINDKLDTHTRTQTLARARQLKLIGDREAISVTNAEKPEPPDNPYKGLQAFQEVDAPNFFGREALVERVLVRLSEIREMTRFLAVVGPSGSGKSSVVQAGLIPALRQGKLSSFQQGLIAQITPGSHPLEELEIALLRLAPNPPNSLLPQLREDERGLLRAVRRVLPDDNSQLLLVIDQFEEVFTLVENPDERQQFLALLHAAVTDDRSPLHIVITLRADFYDRPLLYSGFGELIRQRTEVVLPLTVSELEQAISRPAAKAGVTLESGLAMAIVREADQQPGELPLLQYALTELFESGQGSAMTLEAYQAIGGLLGALARRADALYEALDDVGKNIVQQLFLRLVTLGEGVEDTRRRVLLTELRSLSLDANQLDDLIQTFAAYRLLTLDHDPITRTPTVELAHEALIRAWLRLRGWLDESRADIRLQRLLAASAAEWQNAKQDSGFLMSGARLTQFEDWVAKTQLTFTADERTFLDASLAQRDRQATAEQQRRTREKKLEHRSRNFLRIIIVVLLLATLGAFGLTSAAISERQIAEANAAESQSQALASEAQLQLNQGNTDQAIALAKASQQNTNNPPPLAQRVLDEAAYAPGTQRIFQAADSFVPAALTSPKRSLHFVMVAHMGPQDPFAQTVIKGMNDACAFLNASCQWLSALEYDMSAEQIGDHWKDALALNPDGIGTTITDPNVIHDYVTQAAQQGIPVVAFNVASSEQSLPLLLYIGSNEFASGQTNARRVLAEAKADGVPIQHGVCALQQNYNNAITTRCAGVKSVFENERIPFDQLPISDSSWETVASQLADYFAQHPNTNAVFMLGSGPASALDMYIHKEGLKPRQLYATTHDTSPEIFQMIRDGYLLQTIDQQPYMQGFQTIMSLYLYRQYGIRPSGFINTSSVIDKSNVDAVAQLVDAGYR